MQEALDDCSSFLQKLEMMPRVVLHEQGLEDFVTAKKEADAIFESLRKNRLQNHPFTKKLHKAVQEVSYAAKFKLFSSPEGNPSNTCWVLTSAADAEKESCLQRVEMQQALYEATGTLPFNTWFCMAKMSLNIFICDRSPKDNMLFTYKEFLQVISNLYKEHKVLKLYLSKERKSQIKKSLANEKLVNARLKRKIKSIQKDLAKRLVQAIQ